MLYLLLTASRGDSIFQFVRTCGVVKMSQSRHQSTLVATAMMAMGVVVVVFLATGTSALPWEPEPQPTQAWMVKHNEFVKNTRENGHNINIVFMGSSSIERWGTTGRAIWDAKFAPLGAVNYGIGSDRTEHVLWRLENGEVDGLRPKMAVIYIGSNNVPRNNDTEVIRGITAVLDKFREKLPDTKLLFMGIFPRGNLAPINTTFERILSINAEVDRVHNDNLWTTILSIFWDLAPSMGQLHTELYESDLLHLNRDGYTQWDQSMNETFYRIWNS